MGSVCCRFVYVGRRVGVWLGRGEGGWIDGGVGMVEFDGIFGYRYAIFYDLYTDQLLILVFT